MHKPSQGGLHATAASSDPLQLRSSAKLCACVCPLAVTQANRWVKATDAVGMHMAKCNRYEQSALSPPLVVLLLEKCQERVSAASTSTENSGYSLLAASGTPVLMLEARICARGLQDFCTPSLERKRVRRSFGALLLHRPVQSKRGPQRRGIGLRHFTAFKSACPSPAQQLLAGRDAGRVQTRRGAHASRCA